MRMLDELLRRVRLIGRKRRIVLLPRELETKLDNLVPIEDEVNGILLYKLQEGDDARYCPIACVYMTGEGIPGHAQADPQRMDVANKFFRRHPDYRFVKFHTHCNGTIARFGEYYAMHFSPGDIEGYEEQLTHVPDFIGMVVTPQTKLLYAPDNPKLRIVDTYPEELDRQIQEELMAIAQEKGFHFQPFRTKIR